MDIPTYRAKVTIRNGYLSDSDIALPPEFRAQLKPGDPYIVAWGSFMSAQARVYEHSNHPYASPHRVCDFTLTLTVGSAIRSARRWCRRHYGERELIITLVKP